MPCAEGNPLGLPAAGAAIAAYPARYAYARRIGTICHL